MRSAFLLSTEPGLFDAIYRAGPRPITDPPVEDMLQYHDERFRLLTVYGETWPALLGFPPLPAVTRWAGACEPPNTAELTTCYVECRWKDVLCHWVKYVADHLDTPLWVLDSAGVLWPAKDIDPDELAL